MKCHLVGLAVAVMLSGCGVTAAQLRAAGTWVDKAERACGSPCRDSAPKACVAAVLTAAAPAAGRSEYAAATAACKPFQASK